MLSYQSLLGTSNLQADSINVDAINTISLIVSNNYINVNSFNYTFPGLNDTLVTLTATQTLINKSLTGPIISGGTINNCSIGSITPSTGVFSELTSNGIFSCESITPQTYNSYNCGTITDYWQNIYSANTYTNNLYALSSSINAYAQTIISIDSSGSNVIDIPLILSSKAYESGISQTQMFILKGGTPSSGYGGYIAGYINQDVGSGLIFGTISGESSTQQASLTLSSSGEISTINNTLDYYNNIAGCAYFSDIVTIENSLIINGASSYISLEGSSGFNNNMLELYPGNSGVTSTDVYGLGVNSSTLRYNSQANHIWYANNAELLQLGSAGRLSFFGTSPPNIDWCTSFNGSNRFNIGDSNTPANDTGCACVIGSGDSDLNQLVCISKTDVSTLYIGTNGTDSFIQTDGSQSLLFYSGTDYSANPVLGNGTQIASLSSTGTLVISGFAYINSGTLFLGTGVTGNSSRIEGNGENPLYLCPDDNGGLIEVGYNNTNYPSFNVNSGTTPIFTVNNNSTATGYVMTVNNTLDYYLGQSGYANFGSINCGSILCSSLGATSIVINNYPSQTYSVLGCYTDDARFFAGLSDTDTNAKMSFQLYSTYGGYLNSFDVYSSNINLNGNISVGGSTTSLGYYLGSGTSTPIPLSSYMFAQLIATQGPYDNTSEYCSCIIWTTQGGFSFSPSNNSFTTVTIPSSGYYLVSYSINAYNDGTTSDVLSSHCLINGGTYTPSTQYYAGTAYVSGSISFIYLFRASNTITTPLVTSASATWYIYACSMSIQYISP